MRLSFLCTPFVAFLVFVAPPATAQALKGAGTCNDEYKANKAAIKAAKEKKADFVAACRALPLGTPTPIGTAGGPASRSSDVGTFKTAGQCDDEYKQAKAALKAAKEKKKDFVARCRSLPPGTVTPINGAEAAPAPGPIPQSPTPAPQQAPAAPGPAAPTAPTGANQFQTDGQAKARCPGQSVVWLNTKSNVYHYPGKRDYGHTKQGAYMCESDAQQAGGRASRNGQ